MAKYIVKTGESLTLELNIMEENYSIISSVKNISALLKKAGASGTVPVQNAPIVARFDSAETYSGWEFTLTPSMTSTLAPGMYIMDAKLTMDSGEVEITDPVQIEVKGSVS